MQNPLIIRYLTLAGIALAAQTMSLIAYALTPQQAYVAYEKNVGLGCNAVGPQLPDNQSYLKFMTAHHFIETYLATTVLAPGAIVQSSMSFDNLPFTISLNLTPNDQGSLKYVMSVAGKGYDQSSISGILNDPLQKFDINLSRSNHQVLSLNCWVNSLSDYQFTAADLAEPVHFTIHPQRMYDYRHDGLLAPKVDPILNDQRVRSVILLESVDGIKPLNKLMNGQADIQFDPELVVNPNAMTDFRAAPNGVINFHAYKGQIPTKMILTGGFFNACMSHMLDGFFEELRQAQTNLIQIAMPLNAVLVQKSGDAGSLPEGYGNGLTLGDVQQKSADAFKSILTQFLQYHVSQWKQEEAAFPALSPSTLQKDVTMSFIDPSGSVMASRSTNIGASQRVVVKFNLVTD